MLRKYRGLIAQPLPGGCRSKGLRPVGRAGYTNEEGAALQGSPFDTPCSGRVGDWRLCASISHIPLPRQGVSHSHPPYAGRPVVHWVRAGNAKPRAWQKVGLRPCQDGLCDEPQPGKARPSVAWWLADRRGGDPKLRTNADRTTPAFRGAMQLANGDRLMGTKGQSFPDRKALSSDSLHPKGQKCRYRYCGYTS